MRFSGWLPTPAQAGWVVIALGAVGALFGIAFAFAQNDLKRLLAYCSVENVGVILIGLGAALLGAAHGDAVWGRLALVGALLHVWNHGLFKALLFFGAGSVRTSAAAATVTRRRRRSARRRTRCRGSPARSRRCARRWTPGRRDEDAP